MFTQSIFFKILYNLFWYLDPKIRVIIGKISYRMLHSYLYRVVYKRKPNLNEPILFTEKLIWLMQNYSNDLLVQCTDKYAVRGYVEDKVGPHILNEIYDVYERVEDINFELLPNQFVLKCTHGCGCNIIVSDKNKFDENQAIKKLKKWMEVDYSVFMGEAHYRKIKPRIICEKFIGSEANEFATDYKIWCFNGEPKFLIVITNRGTGMTLTYRDFEWNLLDYASSYYPQELEQKKPACLDEMILYAKALSKDIPFVRADFYDFNGEVVFGELTFTPAGGVPPYVSLKGDEEIGRLLDISNIPS